MLRHLLQTTQTQPPHWRGHAMFCFGLILVSVWLSVGCEPPAERTSPTSPPVEGNRHLQQDNSPLPNATPAHSPAVPDTDTTARHTAFPASPITWKERTQQLAENPELLSQERFRASLALMQGTTREERLRLVADKPLLMWEPGFIVPRTVHDEHTTGLGDLYDYNREGIAVKSNRTESQKRRIDKLLGKYHRTGITAAEEKRLSRKIAAIKSEGLDSLTAAKFFQSYGEDEFAREYTEKAIREQPDSAEALHFLAYLQDTPAEEAKVLRRLLARHPNSAIALRDLAGAIYMEHPAEALACIQKAIQLDSRIPPQNVLLAWCYERLGQYDKALETYQAIPAIGMWTQARIWDIQWGKPDIQPLQE